jgi:DNA-binding MarR family transcriptional regulator
MIALISTILQSNKTTEDLTARQLRMLVLASEATPGVTIRHAASSMKISKPACTRSADKLGDLGLVQRKPDASDKRSVDVCVTPAGRKLLRDLNAAIAKGQAAADRGSAQVLG